MGPTPLAFFLDSTYTPTPIYVDTPHPLTEDYRSAMNAYRKGNWDGVIQFMEGLLGADPEAVDA